MQDRCLGMYIHQPLIKFVSYDRDGNKKFNSHRNDDSQRVIYHLKAPTESWTAERVTPYLYIAANEPRELPANGKCGPVLNYPIECEDQKDLVKW
jgi:hypothetical protein